MLKIVKGSKYEEIKESLKQTDGYCPCTAPYLWGGANGDNFKCMCKEFKEQKIVGECHCQMFKKVEGDENV